MSFFNPTLLRESFLRHNCSLVRDLVQAKPEANLPVGNIAICHLDEVLICWLIGLSEAVGGVTARATEWLTQAIKVDEEFGERRWFHRARLQRGLALSLWMSKAESCAHDWKVAALAENEAWLEDVPATDSEVIHWGLDSFMAYCTQAGEYEFAIATYERYVGVKPITLKGSLAPRKLAYAICLNQTRGLFDEEVLFNAGRRVLSSQISSIWLSKGRAVEAAMWLKIVYWDRDVRAGRGPSMSPVQTILMAYENMPEVPVPNFLPAQDLDFLRSKGLTLDVVSA